MNCELHLSGVFDRFSVDQGKRYENDSVYVIEAFDAVSLITKTDQFENELHVMWTLRSVKPLYNNVNIS